MNPAQLAREDPARLVHRFKQAEHSTRRSPGDLLLIACQLLQLATNGGVVSRGCTSVTFEFEGYRSHAVDTLLDVLKTDPRDSRALVILGNHYARQDGQRDTALKLIRRACEVAPDDATAHNSLGGLLFEEKLIDQAVAEFNEAIRIDPKLANAYYGRSMVEMGAAR